MRRELISVDLVNNLVLFYNITIEKKGGQYCLIEHSGKIGNKGVKKIILEDKPYSICKSEFWNRIRTKENEHYRDKKSVLAKVNTIFGYSNYLCDICGCHLGKELHRKIERYLSSKDIENDDLKGKILCFDCQKKNGLYEYEKK